MKAIIKRFVIIPLLLLVAGCVNEDDLNHSNNDNGIYSLKVQMPESDNPTRVDLTQVEGTKDLKATWKANDKVLVLLTQGDKDFNTGTWNVSEISEDGKQATIYFGLPDGINQKKPFTVYGFTGIEATVQYYEDNKWHPRCMAELQRAPIEKFKAPMFAQVEANYGQTSITSFHHFGTYELLHVKNNSNESVSIAHNGFDIDMPWYQAAAFVEPNDGNGPVRPSGEWDGDDFSVPQTIAAGAEGVFISWYIPSGFPIAEAHLLASVNGKEISSTNTFSSEVSLERGHAYHMYATWDGEELKFDKGGESPQDYPVAEAIDLGLPSGTKWASWNVGASAPEEYGGYFAWGETEEKDYYYWNTYTHCDGTKETCHDIGDDIAGTEYDVAHVKWGGSWRMPTKVQIRELINNCTRTWTQLNGVNGILVTGPNGNTIFLPAASYKSRDKIGSGSGNYWSSLLYNEGIAYSLRFTPDIWNIDGTYDRYGGHQVRPVSIESIAELTVSYNSINLDIGKSTAVEVTSGSGYYEITNSDTGVVKATLNGTTITLRGLSEGNSVVIVKDLYSGQKENINITVSIPSRDYPVAEAIDLGLPSGTLWASWNVGASAPEEYGYYYAWGETEEKDYYDWSTYMYFNDEKGEIIHNCDGLTGTKYDVAHVKWGGPWCMPSQDQIEELFDNCAKEWKQQNGVNGMLVTGPNGNTIFLPAAGSRKDDILINEGSVGSYWTTTLHFDDAFRAMSFSIVSTWTSWSVGSTVRYYGCTVRPVITPEKPQDCPIAEAIDLGLPSGTKWASWNVGASAPEEYGGCYAWGETEEKDYYDWSTYAHCDGSRGTCHHIGDDIAGTEYDVAHVKWGGSWRMPTRAQQDELRENCTREWTQQNGVNGIRVTGPNGNSIFLPAAGSRWNGYLDNEGSYGYYWSSSLDSGNEGYAYFLYFSSGGWGWSYYYDRNTGKSVRAVCP